MQQQHEPTVNDVLGIDFDAEMYRTMREQQPHLVGAMERLLQAGARPADIKTAIHRAVRGDAFTQAMCECVLAHLVRQQAVQA